MTRLVVHEAARWVRALAFAAVGLAVVVRLHQPVGKLQSALPISHARTVWAVALAAAIVWLATAALRAALQPRRDRRAAEHLQDMRVRARLPDHALLCILRVLWASPAGERVEAVDVRTGAVHAFWLAEARVAPGSYALVGVKRGARRLLESADSVVVLAAQRHEERSRLGADPRHGVLAARDRRAAADVIHGAEALIRRSR